jgi:CRP-like cAMP-binding protein
MIPKGAYLFEEGDPADHSYFVEEGRLEVISRRGGVLAEVKAGGVVGELGLLNDAPRIAGVRALEDTRCIVISKAHLLSSLASSPSLTRAILLSMARHLKNSAKARSRNISLPPAPEAMVTEDELSSLMALMATGLQE